jgi:hypothetical protein
MFDKAEELKRHLIEDHFFNGSRILNIIDDYHVKNIKDEAIKFFRDGFQDTGVENINIYFQIKEIKKGIKERRENEIRALAKRIDETYEATLSFLVFLLTSISFNNGLDDKLRETYLKGDADKLVKSALRFIDALHTVNINVTFKPYSSLGFRPPFHGRYWINEVKGYIVDASLDTYLSGRVFAQLMDDENYQIINGLFNHEVEPRTRRFSPMNGDTIRRVHNKISKIYR